MIAVNVQRPFYGQAWFLVLSALVVMAGVWGWLKWRIWNHHQEQARLQNEIHLATARIEADKELIEAQALALQQLNEAKSRFFTNISHEFRTPLTVILGMAAEINEKAQGEQMGFVQRSSALIERNGRNLLRLINQILDLSKLEAGEMQVQPTRADLVNFAHYVTESFHSMAAVKGIQLHFQVGKEVLDTDFDRDKLQDILSNLLTNALKFTPVGGQVTIQLATHENWFPLDTQGYYEAISPTQHLNEPWIFISVRDTGSGIEANKLPQIFDRFFQVATRPVSETGGTGIGLSLVRELLVLMKGGLAVRSRPGEGTEFVVWLRHTQHAPMAPKPVASPVSTYSNPLDTVEPKPAETGEKPILLLVEDNDDVATYILSCIQTKYQIIRAENGQLGIDLAFDQVPDLILSDVMMPLKDGFQLCDELKNDPRTSHIPIVLLTARAAMSDRLSGLRRGADAYLTKPFQQEELEVVLTNLLQYRRLLQLHYSQQLRQPSTADQPVARESDSLENHFLHKLREVLEPQLDNPQFSIDELCQQIGMSRSTLHRKLVGLTDMSISQFIRVLRLGKARDLLTTTKLNISEVAYQVGFDDPKYFSRVFSEEFGVSPIHFRRSGQLEQ